MVLAAPKHEAELEALLRLEAARRLADAILAGEWEPTPAVLECIGLLLRQAQRRFVVAGWAA